MPKSKTEASDPNQFLISPKRIDVAFLPSLNQPDWLIDRTVIVTDVLRATTTIINAISNGCQTVFPRPSIDSARLTHQQTPNSVMGGERGGKIIDGFHHGNSPVEYTREVIAGKNLVLATTNGTVAMEHCRSAQKILIGAMINIGAIAEQIQPDEPVTIVCSGTDGYITAEDITFAGAMVQRILESSSNSNGQNFNGQSKDQSQGQTQGQTSAAENHLLLTDHAAIALNHWQSISRAVEQGTELAHFFRTARGGINLVKIGHDADIVFASKIDTVPIVPQLNVERWAIE